MYKEIFKRLQSSHKEPKYASSWFKCPFWYEGMLDVSPPPPQSSPKYVSITISFRFFLPLRCTWHFSLCLFSFFTKEVEVCKTSPTRIASPCSIEQSFKTTPSVLSSKWKSAIISLMSVSSNLFLRLKGSRCFLHTRRWSIWQRRNFRSLPPPITIFCSWPSRSIAAQLRRRLDHTTQNEGCKALGTTLPYPEDLLKQTLI